MLPRPSSSSASSLNNWCVLCVCSVCACACMCVCNSKILNEKRSSLFCFGIFWIYLQLALLCGDRLYTIHCPPVACPVLIFQSVSHSSLLFAAVYSGWCQSGDWSINGGPEEKRRCGQLPLPSTAGCHQGRRFLLLNQSTCTLRV